MPGTGRTGLVVGKRGAAPDRRVKRTLDALLQAFIGLLLERPYRGVTIADIVDRADVGRSTFYDHFRNKDDILLASMGWMFDILADAVRPDAPREPLDDLVAHFWANRRLGRAVLAPPVEAKLRRALAAAVEKRLAAGAPADPAASKIHAVRIAAAQLGLLEAWTRGELSASPDRICDAIRASARR